MTGKGNITAFAEFNIAVDPESAQSVLTGWPNAELVDWEATLDNAPSIAETESWLTASSANATATHTAAAAPGSSPLKRAARMGPGSIKRAAPPFAPFGTRWFRKWQVPRRERRGRGGE